VVGMTPLAVQQAHKTNAENAIALTEPVPGVVDLSEFDADRDIGRLNEVHVAGWFNTAYSKHSIKKKNTVRSER
jgi:hypothetical protein